MADSTGRRLSRYALTGGLVTSIHAAAATFAVAVGDVSPPDANGMAFLVATSASYIINTYWSFSTRPRRTSLLRFLIVAVLGGTTAMTVSGLAHWFGFHYAIGIALVVVTVPPLTFVLHNSWTYNTARDLRE